METINNIIYNYNIALCKGSEVSIECTLQNLGEVPFQLLFIFKEYYEFAHRTALLLYSFSHTIYMKIGIFGLSSGQNQFILAKPSEPHEEATF